MERQMKLAAAISAVGLMLGAGVVNQAVAQSDTRVIPEVEWNTPLKKFQVDSDKFIGQRFSVKCPPRTVRDKDDPIYGTNVYPSNNPICVAAVHAGATTTDGGVVTVQLNPGLEAYSGSSQNGVASADLPGTPRSMVFVTDGDNSAADAIQQEYLPRLKWSTKFTATGLANKDLVGQRFAFNCPGAPGNLRPRRISGTDSYAFNSVVCVAAVHAGKITMDGGVVTVQMDPGMPKLVGSIRNGIESKDGPGGHTTISFVDAPATSAAAQN